MTSPTVALISAIVAALAADTTLGGLIATERGTSLSAPFPIYAGLAPPDEKFPWLIVSEQSAKDWDTSDSYGRQHSVAVQVYSRGSEASVHAMLDRVWALLAPGTLTLTDNALVLLRQTSLTVSQDGDAWRGIALFDAITERT